MCLCVCTCVCTVPCRRWRSCSTWCSCLSHSELTPERKRWKTSNSLRRQPSVATCAAWMVAHAGPLSSGQHTHKHTHSHLKNEITKVFFSKSCSCLLFLAVPLEFCWRMMRTDCLWCSAEDSSSWLKYDQDQLFTSNQKILNENVPLLTVSVWPRSLSTLCIWCTMKQRHVMSLETW